MQSKPEPPAPRPALGPLNLPVTVAAAAECLAGAFLAGASVWEPLPYVLAAASALLFAAGSAFGDHFERATAARNPDRRPDGPDDGAAAWRQGWVLLLLGAALPVLGGRNSVVAAVGVALLVILYYGVTRTVWGVGYATAGAARALNLILGLTAHEFGVNRFYGAGLGIFLYTVGWEVFRTTGRRDSPPTTPFVALLHLAGGVAALLYFAAGNQFYWVDALVFVIPGLGLAFPWFVNTVMDPRPGNVAAGVQFGFLGLSLLEAGLAAGLAGLPSALLVGALCLALFFTLRRWPISPLGRG